MKCDCNYTITISFMKAEDILVKESDCMSEKSLQEKMEPMMKDLHERVTMLEAQAKMGKEKVETFTKEQPLMALGIAFLVGAGFGLMFGKASRSRD